MVSDALNRIASAAEKIARLEPRLEAARQERIEAIREAHAGGASVAVLARVAGLTRQRVDQIVRG